MMFDRVTSGHFAGMIDLLRTSGAGMPGRSSWASGVRSRPIAWEVKQQRAAMRFLGVSRVFVIGKTEMVRENLVRDSSANRASLPRSSMMIANRALPAVSRNSDPGTGREFRARHDFYFQHGTPARRNSNDEFSGLHREILRQMIANRGRIEIRRSLPAPHARIRNRWHFSRQFEVACVSRDSPETPCRNLMRFRRSPGKAAAARSRVS